MTSRQGRCSNRMAAGVRDPVKIVANIFISFIGAGVLGLPFAFKKVRSVHFYKIH